MMIHRKYIVNQVQSGLVGSGDINGTYTQTTLSDTWTITHNIGKISSVDVYILEGSTYKKVEAFVSENTAIKTVVKLSEPHRGFIKLN